MILVGANILIYAYSRGLQQSNLAREWLDSHLNGSSPVGLPWASLLAFVRIVSNDRIFERPVTASLAWVQVEEWLDAGPAWIPQPTDRHRQILGELLQQVGNEANLVPDAHLAALAIEHGLTLYSADLGFGQFGSLSWVNPLA